MALPPDSAESFAREVDESLRRDQAEEFLKKNGALIVGGVLLLLAAIAGWMYWQDRQAKAAAADSETLVAAIDQANQRPRAGLAKLEPLTDSSSEGIAAQARLMKAAALLDSGNTAGAIAAYREIAADGGLAQPYRDLATVRVTALEFDSLKAEEVISRLGKLADPGSPWLGSAGEIKAMALLKLNRKDEAGRLFAAIAADRGVPTSIRSRAVQIAGTLGVDATAAIADISKG